LHKDLWSFLQVCKLLRDGVDTQAIAALTDGEWELILATANRHRVSPAIWANLVRNSVQSAVRQPIQTKLANIYELNTRRNRLIKREAAQAADWLNASGITPLMLKTSVNLLEAAESELGKWVTRDIDLLVDRDSFFPAAQILEHHGFRAKGDYNPQLHSYPALAKSGNVVTIDLHRDVGPQRNVLPVSEALRDARVLSEQPKILALPPTQRMVHLLYHGEIQDRRHELANVSLHQLVNFETLLRRYGDEIDWADVSARLSRAGSAAVLPSYLYLANRLLGLEHSRWPAPSPRARLHYGRWNLQMRSAFLTWLVQTWGVITPVMSRSRIEYFGGDAGDALSRTKYRLALGWTLIQRNGLTIFSKIAKVRQLRMRK
jgi:hypothetical protein